MDDRTFFDHLFQQFARTTGAENTFWMVEEDTKHYAAGPQTWNVWSVNSDQERSYIGSFNCEEDADFVAGLHGCLPDLVRRLHDALDEADLLDTERDEAEQNVFRLAVENEELRQELYQLRRERESWVTRAGDALWKIERPM